jgi:hypothetical protein
MQMLAMHTGHARAPGKRLAAENEAARIRFDRHSDCAAPQVMQYEEANGKHCSQSNTTSRQ